MADRHTELRDLKSHRIRFTDLLLYEDDACAVVNKPQGIASLEDRSMPGFNMLALAKAHFGDAHLCHRLDKFTSGALVVAKNEEAYKAITLQFQHREVAKNYHALVHGTERFENREISIPLTITRSGMVKVDLFEGKPSTTYVDTLHTWRDHSLVSCEPVTGRMHQIRVHLSYVGAPIVGDTDYGGKDVYLSELKRGYKFSSRHDELPVNHGYMLHAHAVVYTSPATGAEVLVEAPYPHHFTTLMKLLGKYGS